MRKCLFITVFMMLFACRNDNDRINPSFSSITESVYSSVTVLPDSLYAVFAAVGGILDQNLVDEGDVVSQGDDLFNIVNSVPAINIENAKLLMDQARSNYQGSATLIRELENDISAARLKFRNDSIKLNKQKRLWKNGIGTQNELDNLELAYELSLNQLTTLTSRLHRTKKDLDTQLKTAENNYLNSLKVNEDYTIKSVINGKVYEVTKNPGELVSSQEPLAYIGSKDVFILEMLVDEVDIGKIQPNQKILVVLDVFGKEVFEAKVTTIAPKMDDRTQTFLVKGLFDQQPSPLYSGLTGEANIIISKHEQVLTIPLSYLINDQYVLTEDGEVSVETGIRDLKQIEIRAGLDTSSILIKPR